MLVSPRSRGTNTPLKIYQYLRSGKPIVATRLLTHTQVLERRHGDPDRRDAAGVRRRHPRRRSTIRARAAAIGAPRARSWPRRSTATRRISSARGRPAPRCCRRAAAGAVVEGRRVSRSRRPRSLQLHRLRRPGDGADVRRPPVRRADRRAGRRRAGARARQHGRARSRTGTMLDVGTGTGRAALLLARGGARVTGVDASEEMLADRAPARGRAARQGARSSAATRTRSTFADRSFDVVVSLRVLMHTPRLAALRRRAVPRRRSAGDRRLSVGDERRAARVAGAAGCCTRVGVRTEPYRVFTAPRDRRRVRPQRLPDPLGAPAVRPADRAAQGDRIAPVHAVVRSTCSTAPAC